MALSDMLIEFLPENVHPEQTEEYVKSLLGKPVLVSSIYDNSVLGKAEFRGLFMDEHESLCAIISWGGSVYCNAVHFSRVKELNKLWAKTKENKKQISVSFDPDAAAWIVSLDSEWDTDSKSWEKTVSLDVFARKKGAIEVGKREAEKRELPFVHL